MDRDLFLILPSCLRRWVITFEGHEGGIINEFSLFHHLENKLKAVICHPRTFPPVQEVVVVHHTTTEVRLREDGDVVHMVLVRLGLCEAVAEA